MVYTLGRVLWCIFEAVSAPEIAVWQSYKFETDLQFPGYEKTPLKMREIIDACTKGRKEGGGMGEGIVRKGNKLVIRGGDGTETAGMVQEEARRWWRRELEVAEGWLERREERIRSSDGDVEDIFGRPKLREVLEMLEGFRDMVSG